MKLGTFWKCEDPPPKFELFPTETWDFFDFLTTPPLFGLIPKFGCFFDWKASLKELANKREEKKAMELYLSGLLLERWWSRKLPLITNSGKQT